MTEHIVQILLVEDNSSDAELTIKALDKHHLANKVHWVKDGAEALDFLFGREPYADAKVYNNRPKLVLLDIKLPKVDGIEVLRQVRANEKTKLIPVVILTSSREDRDLVESYKLGANSYIAKPVEFDEFTKIVAALGLYWTIINEVPYKPGMFNR